MKISPKSITFPAIIATLAITASAPAASVSISLNQTTNGTADSNTVDVTAQGTMDWAVFNSNGTFTGSTIAVHETMNGGVGFTSLTALGGATNQAAMFVGAENTYSWTNGTAESSADTGGTGAGNDADRIDAPNNGDGVRLTFIVTTAASYQLIFYSATFGINVNGIASLDNGAVTDNVNGILTTGSVQNYVYTVDFTTDGADTLTLDIVKSGGTNTVLAVEAFTAVPEPSSTAMLGLGALGLLLRRRRA